tara:strand:- start:41 stop:205 length:165 start_codon:yes stop_codon:yes gene_type:complete
MSKMFKLNPRIKNDIEQILDDYEIDEFYPLKEQDFHYLVKNLVEYVENYKKYAK